ncbi:chemotaxis protein CheW [Halieaceae bacterium IMCC14734]|uniref:Chemotaxis protein CheW n=1 Tax=Candidatus Litorirhabdus singularis TaxID=2518993 RepID=A0ABT3TDU3_9GAMM|nr:CheW domain-containing protein [Candidatus Litorirhabdus singularis]MCX2980424.1 chemotaxis protein CheW [Candidatus Litorirhabdus singularis]
MDQVNFDRLRAMAQHIGQNAAPVPLANRYVEYWYGAAFEVLGVRCAVSLEEIRKIVDVTPTVPIPGVKRWVRGLANIGGRLLSIADFSSFLSGGEQTSNGKQAFIVSGRGIHTGLLIDANFGGVRFPKNELRTDVAVAQQLQPYVSGVYTAEDGDYAVFSIERLLNDTDFSQAGIAVNN